MSLRLEMLQVARLAPKVLGDSTELIREYLTRKQNPDGGFQDRAGKSDLYYTVFGMDALLAIQSDRHLEKTREYIHSFHQGNELDFVHLCCLARGWAGVTGGTSQSPFAQDILQRIESFRTTDGGYNPKPGASSGTAYANFLAFGACLDLGEKPPEPLRLVQSFKHLETSDGAWLNERVSNAHPNAVQDIGSTNATAAVITLLRNLEMPVNTEVGDWLVERFHPQGGFLATPQAPVPDLLSTATALHALSGMQYNFEHLKEPCLDFVDSLWTNEGGFHGNWTDDILDCEYTFYGLLALGHLSL